MSPTSRASDHPARLCSSRLRRVVLHLVHGTGFPSGSELHGYELVAPLDEEGRLDADLWRQERDRCRVVRFWTGVPDLRGRLQFRRRPDNDETWFLDFDPSSTDDDEYGYRLDRRRFVPGGNVSLHDTTNVHKFHVVSISDL